MKNKIMAQILLPGDIVLSERRKYVISATKTVGEETIVLYWHGKPELIKIAKFPKNEFLTVTNDGRF